MQSWSLAASTGAEEAAHPALEAEAHFGQVSEMLFIALNIRDCRSPSL